jgi:methyl-accepting chemotaxis protein
MKNRQPRWNKLVKPWFQMRLVLIFATIATISLLMQFLLMQSRMVEMASAMPDGGDYVVDALPDTLRDVLLVSFGVLLPLILAVGVLVTFRIAGPVYRFEQYLKQVAEGKTVGPCRIRKDDELQDLCSAINRALERIQVDTDGAEEAGAESEDERRELVA